MGVRMDDAPEDLVRVVGRDGQAEEIGRIDLVAEGRGSLVASWFEAQRPAPARRRTVADDQAAGLVRMFGPGVGDDVGPDLGRQVRVGRARVLTR